MFGLGLVIIKSSKNGQRRTLEGEYKDCIKAEETRLGSQGISDAKLTKFTVSQAHSAKQA